MDTLSPVYALLILGGAALFWGARRTPLGGLVLLATGVAFYAPDWLALGAFGAAAAVTIIGIRTGKTAVAIVALVLLLAAFKSMSASWWPAGGAGGLARIALPVGVSYYVLRGIAALVESSRGLLKSPTILETAGFLGFAPILTLGPIERASSFLGQWRRQPAARDAFTHFWVGVGRIAEGLFKVLVISKILERHAEPFVSGRTVEASGIDPSSLWTALYAYSLFLYVNFSGASDLAIGASRFFGFKIAENFDLPYARPNLSEFWRGWHMSLSTWLRDFLFFPIGKRLPRGAAPIVAPLLVMSICGLWHGITVTFLFWGFLHGAGLAIHQLWLRGRRANEALDRFAGSLLGRTIGAVVTVFYVTLTWIFFRVGGVDWDVAIANLAGLAGAAPHSLQVLGFGAAAVALWSFVPDLREWLRRKAAAEVATVGTHMASLWRAHLDVVLALIVCAQIVLARSQPEGAFVYKGF